MDLYNIIYIYMLQTLKFFGFPFDRICGIFLCGHNSIREWLLYWPRGEHLWLERYFATPGISFKPLGGNLWFFTHWFFFFFFGGKGEGGGIDKALHITYKASIHMHTYILVDNFIVDIHVHTYIWCKLVNIPENSYSLISNNQYYLTNGIYWKCKTFFFFLIC